MSQGAPTNPYLPAAARALAGRKLLLADDDKAVLARIREGLRALGYEFVEANDGHEALSAIREHRPDLVLLDVEMPGMSGVEICRIVKANQGEAGFGFVPIILMTARTGGKVEGLELGADDYLVKPFDMPELAARVKSMLRLKALQDALLEKNRELDRANRELEVKRAELLALSRTDALTGLFNRRYFEERLETEFARSARYAVPLSCLMLDLDHFKQLNDTYGHGFGDQVLKEVAQIAKATLRSMDLLARYGGEELIALLPETGPGDALRVAERIRRAISDHAVPFEGPQGRREVHCTASIGVSTHPSADVPTAEVLLRKADDRLYAAKAAGRDRVMGAER